MFNIIKKEIEWCGQKLVLETGKIARQSDGAVMASIGETKVLCTVVGSKEPKEGIDFFPLTVHYREMYYASGKIPGGFFKREAKPTENEVLTSRLIDRPIRPLFPEGFFNEVQVICTVVSYDAINDPDIVAIVGTSAALAISGIPFNGPIAAIRVGMREGKLEFNPSVDTYAEQTLDLIVAGTADSVLMVESEVKELTEEQMLNAVVEGQKAFRPVISLINEFAKEVNNPRWEVKLAADDQQLKNFVKNEAFSSLEEAYKIHIKKERYSTIANIKSKLSEVIANSEFAENLKQALSIFSKLEEEIVRKNILNHQRIDGRNPTEIRPIATEVSILPLTHGSALFTRGETQSLVVTTLGSMQDEQIIDTMSGDSRQHFMLHYNFPPYSVGETSQLRAPGRREIGHGKLAWRAINPVLPSREEFPYTLRVVSEITESNGSSSMATVCGSSLAMMDAGVPLRAPVAGIAMGLVLEGDKFVVLSDIMGDEDHLGDMDFKVAGTHNGITALQMDIKIPGITAEIMEIALKQAKEGRLHILNEMAKSITSGREEVNKTAPVIKTIFINKEKIGEVIGSGGKVIKDICEKSGAKVDINDTGMIFVSGPNLDSVSLAMKIIKGIVEEPIIGKTYEGKVVKIAEFGAFVNFLGSRDGLVHVSEIAQERVNQVSDHLKEGQIVKVKLIGVDDKGKFKLSIKALLA